MAKASPGGILLLGIGSLLIAAGWSDRLTAVWDALRTGATDGATGAPGDTGMPASPELPGGATLPGPAPKSNDAAYPRVGKHCTGGAAFNYKDDDGCSRRKPRFVNCNSDEYCSDTGSQSITQHCIKKSCTSSGAPAPAPPGAQGPGNGCRGLGTLPCDSNYPVPKTFDGTKYCCKAGAGEAYVNVGVNNHRSVTTRANYTPFGRVGD